MYASLRLACLQIFAEPILGGLNTILYNRLFRKNSKENRK